MRYCVTSSMGESVWCRTLAKAADLVDRFLRSGLHCEVYETSLSGLSLIDSY